MKQVIFAGRTYMILPNVQLHHYLLFEASRIRKKVLLLLTAGFYRCLTIEISSRKVNGIPGYNINEPVCNSESGYC